MKLSPVLLAGVFTFGISSLEAVQDPIGDLRAALGGDAALNAIERLHVKAEFAGDYRGKGETDTYVVLPDRFLEQSHAVQRRSSSTRSTPDKPYPQSTVGFENLTVEDFDTHRVEGFVGSTPFANGELAPKWWKDEWRESSLVAGRYAYARLMIPLLGTASTVKSSYATTGAIVLQDQDLTTWTLKLNASGLPASMTMVRLRTKPGDVRVTVLVNPPVITFSDYRKIAGGLTWPHKFVTTADGKTVETLWVKSYEINGKAPKILLK